MDTSSVKVYELRNSIYETNGGGELIFRIPPSVALINQKETFLKFNLRLGGINTNVASLAGATAAGAAIPANYNSNNKYRWCLDDTIGAEALIKNITILDASETHTLEQITNYNRLSKLIHTYSDNESKKNIKGLFEGRSDRKITGATTHLQKSTIAADNQTQTSELRTIEICLPIRLSGILGGNDLYPNMLSGGLVVKIQLEDDIYKIINAGSNALMETKNPQNNDTINDALGYAEEEAFSFTQTDGSQPTNAALTDLRINQNNTNTNSYRAGLIAYGSGAINNDDELASLPFNVGQTVVIKYQTAGGAQEVERTITQVQRNAGYARVIVNPSIDFSANTEDNPLIFIKAPTEKPNLTLSNLELVVGTVNPTKEQLNSYENAVKSKGGYMYQFKSYLNFPVNVGGNSSRVSNLINCKLSKALSVLSTFENVQLNSVIQTDNLSCPIVASFVPEEYHYIIDNLKVPSRDVKVNNLARTNAQQGSWNAVHIKELSDAMMQCGYKIHNLDKLKNNFVISRGLSRYNHVYNFQQQKGETRLNLNLTSNTYAQLNHNFVAHWRTLIINPSEMVVMI